MKKSATLLSLLTSAILLSGECGIDPSYRFEARYRDPKGVGYDKGYSSATLFFAPIAEPSFTPFLDLRGHVFNDGMWAANGGVGVRKTFGDFIAGLNGYYDYRDIRYLGGQSRLSAGAELLSKRIDLRLNGYASSRNSKFAGPACFSHFACHSAFAFQDIAAMLSSIDLELGAPLPYFLEEVDLYTALGTYYLFEKEVNGFELGKAWGMRGRVDLRVFDGIRLGADVTYDHIFHLRAQGYIGLSMPLGSSNMLTKGARFKEKYKKCSERALLRARELQPVYRQEIIPAKTENVLFQIRPSSFNPIIPEPPEFPEFPGFPGFNPNGDFIFVKNTATGGNGTFERPYSTLIDAEQNSTSGDIIYVFYGDGTSKGQDQGIILQPNQALISSGVPIDLGGVVIPPFDPGKQPLITNAIRQDTGIFFGVEMANRDAVAGFLFDGLSNPNFIAADVTNANSFIFNLNKIINTPNPFVTKTGSLKGVQILIENNIASTGVVFQSDISSSRIGIVGNTFMTPTATNGIITFTGSALNSVIGVDDNLFENSNVIDIQTGTASAFTITNSTLEIIGNQSTKVANNTATISGFFDAENSDIFINSNSANRAVVVQGTINNLSNLEIIGNLFTAPTATNPSTGVINLTGSSTESDITIGNNFFKNSGALDIVIGTLSPYPLTNSVLTITDNHSTKLGTNVAFTQAFVSGDRTIFSNNTTQNTGTNPIAYSALFVPADGGLCITNNHLDWNFELELFSNACLRLVDNITDPGTAIYLRGSGVVSYAEVPNPGSSNLATGLRELNPLAVINITQSPESTQVPTGTCGCGP